MSSDNQLLVVREQISRLILWLSSWSQRETAQTPALRKEAVRWLCTAGPSVNKNVKETKVGQNSTQREFQDDVKGSLGCPGSYGIEKFRNHNLAYILMNLLCKFQFCLWWLPIFFFLLLKVSRVQKAIIYWFPHFEGFARAHVIKM